ncbi:Signal peptidase complex catalytic [Sarcoptes scabiei]|nr:Signal peptidase complex catalytic [Sarcoptes scabiei]
MGVINNFFQNNRQDSDDDWTYLLSDEDESLQIVPTRRRSSYQKRSKKLPSKPEPTWSGLGVKGKSHKKSRRFANAIFYNDSGSILNENNLEEISIEDFIQNSSPSSFSLLVNEIDSFIDYNVLINCTEDQQKILLGEEKDCDFNLTHQKIDGNNVDDCFEDKRKEIADNFHQCFARIAPHIRKRLLQQHVPIGILSSIEQKLVAHFQNYPKSTYKTNLNSSYQRFLLHACCQYLDLYCRSLFTSSIKQ